MRQDSSTGSVDCPSSGLPTPSGQISDLFTLKELAQRRVGLIQLLGLRLCFSLRLAPEGGDEVWVVRTKQFSMSSRNRCPVSIAGNPQNGEGVNVGSRNLVGLVKERFVGEVLGEGAMSPRLDRFGSPISYERCADDRELPASGLDRVESRKLDPPARKAVGGQRGRGGVVVLTLCRG